MSWVKAGHEIESETGHSIDPVSFLQGQVRAGHEIETDAGMQVFFADNTAELSCSYKYKIQKNSPIIVQELCESRGGRPGLSVLTSLLVSVDVKLY